MLNGDTIEIATYSYKVKKSYLCVFLGIYTDVVNQKFIEIYIKKDNTKVVGFAFKSNSNSVHAVNNTNTIMVRYSKKILTEKIDLNYIYQYEFMKSIPSGFVTHYFI
jgi:hypothetical protein